jgi:hypothetical protein
MTGGERCAQEVTDVNRRAGRVWSQAWKSTTVSGAGLEEAILGDNPGATAVRESRDELRAAGGGRD